MTDINPTRTNVKASKPADFEDLWEKSKPGLMHAYTLSEECKHGGYLLCCPGCVEILILNTQDETTKPCWTETGSLEEGTLTIRASIHHSPDGCGWHGWLNDGVFTSV